MSDHAYILTIAPAGGPNLAHEYTDGQRALSALDVAEQAGRVSSADLDMAIDLVCRGYPPALAVRVALTPTFRHQRGGDE